MATVYITTNITLEQFLDAAAQLSTSELEQLADSIGQLLTNRVGTQTPPRQIENSQVSAINPLGQLINLNQSESVSEPDIHEPDINTPDINTPDNGTSLTGVTLPIVKTLIPDSLTLDGDSLSQ